MDKINLTNNACSLVTLKNQKTFFTTKENENYLWKGSDQLSWNFYRFMMKLKTTTKFL